MKKNPGKKPSTKKALSWARTREAVTAYTQSLPRKANLIIIGFLFAWALLLYGNTLRNSYAIDDSLLTENDMVRQGVKAIPAIFSSYLLDEDKYTGGQTNDYRPVAKASYAIEYSLWGEKPGRSHLVSVFLYFIASLITFYVLRRLLINFNILFPVLITVLFMAHPVHTEVVASLRNRDEILAYLFGMAGMYNLLSYISTRKIRFVVYTCAWFMIACISKQSALPFAGLYILVLYFFGNLKTGTIMRLGFFIFLAAGAAFLIPGFIIPHAPRSSFYFENALYFEKKLWLRLGTAMMSLLFYLRILFYPHPLLYYYGYNMIPLASLWSPLAQLSALVYTVLLVYAGINIRRKKFLAFAILWYLVSIFMYSNLLLPVVGVVAERFVFLASLGFVMALVFLIFRLFKTEPGSLTIEFESRFKIIGLVLVILVPYVIHTVNRNTDWRNIMSLFTKDIPHLQKSAKANYQYAGYLISTLNDDEEFLKYGSADQALRENIKKHLYLSLKVYPGGYNTLNDMGRVFLQIDKRYDSALYCFQKAVAVDPALIPGWSNLGMTYRQLGEYPRALECYQKVLVLEPGNPQAYFAIGEIYSDLGDVNTSLYYYDLGWKSSGKK